MPLVDEIASNSTVAESTLSDPVVLGLLLGLIIAAVYAVSCARSKGECEARLKVAIEIVLSGVGIASGISLGYMVLVTPEKELGSFSDHREAIFLGGFAIVWLAVATLWKAFAPFFAPSEDSPPVQSSKSRTKEGP